MCTGQTQSIQLTSPTKMECSAFLIKQMANLNDFQSYWWLCGKAGLTWWQLEWMELKLIWGMHFFGKCQAYAVSSWRRKGMLLGSYRPNCLEAEHEVMESASAAWQDDDILREKMKLGHKNWDKRRNHTYYSLVIPRLLGSSDQAPDPETDFTVIRMIPVFSSLSRKELKFCKSFLFQKLKVVLTSAVMCQPAPATQLGCNSQERVTTPFPYLTGSRVPGKGSVKQPPEPLGVMQSPGAPTASQQLSFKGKTSLKTTSWAVCWGFYHVSLAA